MSLTGQGTRAAGLDPQTVHLASLLQSESKNSYKDCQFFSAITSKNDVATVAQVPESTIGNTTEAPGLWYNRF